jgi:methyltransferase of FxLD system
VKERAQLVAELRAREAIRTRAVAAAFAEVPREVFIPRVLAEQGMPGVYRDEAFVTKRHPKGIPVSSSSQPGLMATMLELLELRPGQRVLEVGAGTGYNAALIRHLVGASGRVTTIDIDGELARTARSALRRAGYRASVVVGDGRRGWPDGAPYDRIIVTACADQAPRAWLDQLSEGGRIVFPLRLDPDGTAIQLIPVFERRDGRLRSVGMTWGGFMALHGGDGGWRAPRAQVSATRSTGGAPVSLGHVAGAGLAGISEQVARSLLARVISGAGELRARGATPMGSGRTPLLLVHLLLGIPDRRRVSVHTDRRIGIGAVDRRTGSLAVFSVPSPWSRRSSSDPSVVRWRLESFAGNGAGSDGAAAELQHLLQEWDELRRAGRRRLRVTAHARRGAEALVVRFGWERD